MSNSFRRAESVCRRWLGAPHDRAVAGAPDFNSNCRRRAPNAVAMLVLHFAGQSWISPGNEIASCQIGARACREGAMDALLDLAELYGHSFATPALGRETRSLTPARPSPFTTALGGEGHKRHKEHICAVCEGHEKAQTAHDTKECAVCALWCEISSHRSRPARGNRSRRFPWSRPAPCRAPVSGRG